MSEYIVELNDNAVAGGKFLLGSVYLDATQIVRCRDCRWSNVHDGKTYPKGEAYKGRMYCIAWSDGYQGEWVKPDGYCHRAKRIGDGK